MFRGVAFVLHGDMYYLKTHVNVLTGVMLLLQPVCAYSHILVVHARILCICSYVGFHTHYSY